MMQESKLKVFSFSELTANSYNVDYTSLDFGKAPFNGLIGQLEPNAISLKQNHFEEEVFLFLSGKGEIQVDDTKIEIHAGIGVRVAPFMNHVIKNTSVQPLRFISIYWGDKLSHLPKLAETNSIDTTLIFSPLPTPNGDLHLGHLSGPYLAADIYRRYLTECGLTAMHVTGRDDHQTYVAKKAQLEQTTPKAIADHFSKQIRKTLEDYNIIVDYFLEPNQDDAYANFVKTVFKQLYEKGDIYAKTEMAAFRFSDRKYLHEAYIEGNCPFCFAKSDGNACEECGRPNACIDLHNGYDKLNHQPPEYRPSQRLYFKLSRYTDQLSDYIKSTPMSAHAFALSQAMLEDGLPDICVSHLSEWGIATPIPGFQDHIIYVWFELALAFLWSGMQVSPENIGESEKMAYFYNNLTARVVHFYGFDNTYYHTIFFPAIYFALGLQPPRAHVVNELLDLDGSKFSTSRNHLIWGRDLLNNVPLDYVRWFLSETRPEGSRKNFTLAEFTISLNQTFALIQTWMTKFATIITEKFNQNIPLPGAWTLEHRQFLQNILTYRQTALDCYHIENFSPASIVQTLKNLSMLASHFLHAQQSLLDVKATYDYSRTAIALSAFALKIFALLSRPIIPNTANSILHFLGLPKDTKLIDNAFIDPLTTCDISLLPTLVTLEENAISELQHGKSAKY
jgi:methionyl-tRNA synthetase